MSMEVDIEPGPSRPRRPSQPSTPTPTADADDTTSNTSVSSRRSRPASPETAFASRSPGPTDVPPRSPSPQLDLAAYPTATLLHLIANLLQQIASANDQIRPDDTESNQMDDGDTSGNERNPSIHSRSVSRSSTHSVSQPQPSPTAALFDSDDIPPENPSRKRGIDPSSPLPLFTASRTSLVHPSSLLSFHARHVPSISIEAYLLRILKYCPTTNEVFLSLLVYFDRMSRLGTSAGVGAGLVVRNGKGFAIDSFNVHRLVIAGVTVASKFFSDVFYTNSRYAKVGGLPPHELNQLELQFLLLNDFRLAIPTEEMQRYGDRLLAYWEGREEETGVDVESGRELSENGRRRAREKRERHEAKEREREKALAAPRPTEEDAIRASEAGHMEVDQNQSESSPPNPAQPPPEPAETASEPSSPPPDGINGDGTQVNPRGIPKHSDTAPPSSATFVSHEIQQSGSVGLSLPTTRPIIPGKGEIRGIVPGSVLEAGEKGYESIPRHAERERPRPQNHSLSFSRSDSASTTTGIGMGWGRGDQGLVASGTS